MRIGSKEYQGDILINITIYKIVLIMRIDYIFSTTKIWRTGNDRYSLVRNKSDSNNLQENQTVVWCWENSNIPMAWESDWRLKTNFRTLVLRWNLKPMQFINKQIVCWIQICFSFELLKKCFKGSWNCRLIFMPCRIHLPPLFI